MVKSDSFIDYHVKYISFMSRTKTPKLEAIMEIEVEGPGMTTQWGWHGVADRVGGVGLNKSCKNKLRSLRHYANNPCYQPLLRTFATNPCSLATNP